MVTGWVLPRAIMCLALATSSVALFAQEPGKSSVLPKVGESKPCPPGYRPWSRDPSKCISFKHPEPPFEIELRQREWIAPRSAPHERPAAGAFANAVREGDALRKKPPKVNGADGVWTPVGTGPLINNSELYPSTSGLGLVHVAGRIDNFAYDAETNRLFATKGTGGIWLSEDLGESWRSIGDTLPSQIIGAVAWSTYNGGTLIAVSGDPALGTYTYTGFGAFYSRDLGATWIKAQGIPDGAPAFAAEVDLAMPNIVYAATLVGLFRSTDGGATYQNVVLPTGNCAGVEGGTGEFPHCHLANVVTDVVVKAPGGVLSMPGSTSPSAKGSPVLAVVGWRQGRKTNPDGTVQSPNNGLYRSETGEVRTFEKLPGTGFAPPDRIGRVELGAATGPLQDHNYVYAIVQDAVALNGGLEVFDTPEGVTVNDPRPIGPTLPLLGVKLGELGGTNLHGIYASPDFGRTWTLMADDNVIAKNPATGSALAVVGQALGYEPGVQAWYNLWIAPDPTMQTPNGIPTRLAFGLEEVWQNEVVGQPMIGPATFKVIGRYFSDETCVMLGLDLPECPTNRPPTTSKTTHPDQHAGLWIPDRVGGGVTLAVGNDGGFYKQHVKPGQELNNGGWGDGHQSGFHTLLPYDVAIAKDGTVYAGLQDNGHLKITPDGQQFSVYGGDGTFAEVDPDNSNIAYESTPGANIRVSTDGGSTWRRMAPPITNAKFVNPFEMDATDAHHLVTAGRQVVETIYGENTGLVGSEWKRVFDLGTHSRPGDATAVAAPPTDPANSVSALDVYGDAVYVAYCAPCTHVNQTAPFKRGLATNVGGAQPPKRMTSDGWHIATAAGLPNRYIMAVAIDPANPRTVYVALGGYSVRWIPPGTLHDANANIGKGHVFKSTNAGESFVDISGNLPDAPATSLVIRGKQLIVGTDVGVFASDVRGGTTYVPLAGLPVVPIAAINIVPGDCNRLVAATYGRGIYSYTFNKAVSGSCGGASNTSALPNMAPANRIHSGEHAWWGGSQGYAESYMTRSITVPASAAQLKFWTWYDLEDGYDWAFALASADNGQTWTSLITTAANGSGTSPLDPIGTVGALGGNKKYPNGLTGVSGAPPTYSGLTVVAPVMTEHTADFSAYAGKTVLVRFGYSSDPATDHPGFYVDDVRVVDLLGNTLFSDDMEVSGTWSPSGNPGFRWVTKSTTQ
ncbi:MAG TPA: hypothetical protein VEC39_00765 [Vicinamibacterales bacterium]|nr:hypothetical protein [Vicinamibacterales bacterium]